MTRCNVCQAKLPDRDAVSFLCERHKPLAPPVLIQAYLDAARAVQRHRFKHHEPPPEDLVLAAYRAYARAAEAARANAKRPRTTGRAA